MRRNLFLYAALLGVLLIFSPVSSLAGPISFTGQFDPSLATIDTDGGNGSFDASGAPLSVTIWGSDADTGLPQMTLVTWGITSAEELDFYWLYETFDSLGSLWDRAGYYLNDSFIQLSNNEGSNIQSGFVTLPLAVGDVFGFYVYTTDDLEGEGVITISGSPIGGSAVPEPATAALGAFGLAALALLGRHRARK